MFACLNGAKDEIYYFVYIHFQITNYKWRRFYDVMKRKEKGREGKGREGKGREGMGWDGMRCIHWKLILGNVCFTIRSCIR